MTWLDVLILVAIAFFGWLGTRSGLLVGLLELAGLVVSLVVPLLTYVPAGGLLVSLGVPRVYSGAVAFLAIWLIVTNIYFFAARRFYRRVPREVKMLRVNRALGVLPGIVRGVVLVTLFLAIATSLPVTLVSDPVVDDSVIAQPLIQSAVVITAYAADIFGEAVQTALGFLTIHPEAEEVVRLPFKVPDPTIDPEAETEMLRLLNQERTSRGLVALSMDPAIRAVARAHSVDMFRQGYFAHTSLDGTSPFERMRRGNVRFAGAGENLALARSVQIAHAGLMRSPGHRANILRPQFRRIGIGAATSRRHGTMFTQNFAN